MRILRTLTLLQEIEKWKYSAKALREEDELAFEELMNARRSYASVAGSATRPIVTESMLILLSLREMLKEIEETLRTLLSR